MTCDVIKPELLGYHLGTLDLVLRDGIDAHLLACRGCLTRYLEVKRALEDGQLPDERPSPALRARVRADVAAIVAPRPRRIRPAYVVGFAAAAAAIFLFAFELGAGKLHLKPAPQSSQSDSQLIDAQQADTSLKVL